MFALIQGVLLRPLPVPEQDRLLVAWKEAQASGSAHYPFGRADIQAVADSSRLFERVAGVARKGVDRSVVTENGVSSYVDVALVTGGFFDVLGVPTILGRVFTPADDVEAAERVLVISRAYWQRRYGGSPDAIGRRLMLGEQSFTIVGVMPADIDYPSGVEVWRTTSSVPTDGPFGDAARTEVDLIARLRPGVTFAQAASELTALAQRLEADASPGTGPVLVPVVRRFEDVMVGGVRPALLVLFGAVGLVLLIASANVANLLLMRGEGRGVELAVRTALGAGRGRVMRLLCAESLVLALVGGVAGLAVSWLSLGALMALVPGGLPRVESVRIDATVVVFTFAIAVASALLAGLAPMMLSLRTDLLSRLRSSGRGATGPVAQSGRRSLVVAQVALAVGVVAAAALLVGSVLRLQAVDLGMVAARLVLIDLDIPQAKYEDQNQHARFLDEVVARLEAAPAIAAATPVNLTPFSGQGWDVPQFTAEGQSADRAAANPPLGLESIHPNYFETLGATIVRGRAFTSADRQGAVPVAIVSGDVAATTWPGQDPLGKRLKMGDVDAEGPWYTVVGVADTTRYRELTRPHATLYLPAAQFLMTARMLVLRTTAPLDLVASIVRDGVQLVDPDVRVTRIASFSEALERPLARPRFNAFLFSIFGTAALLLSTIGLYAVMAAYVRQRDREIAVRLALGATTTGVRRFVLEEALRLAGVGALIGVAGALASARLLRGMLFEVDPLNPSAPLAAAALMLVAAGVASYIPVRRATRVDAALTLRID